VKRTGEQQRGDGMTAHFVSIHWACGVTGYRRYSCPCALTEHHAMKAYGEVEV